MLGVSQLLKLVERVTPMYDEGKKAHERQVRSHSVRVAILDLLAKDARKLTASQIRAGLPGNPTLGCVNYHLKVLADNRFVVAEMGCFELSQRRLQP